MSRFMNEKYSALEAYTPGEQPQDKKYIKLILGLNLFVFFLILCNNYYIRLGDIYEMCILQSRI